MNRIGFQQPPRFRLDELLLRRSGFHRTAHHEICEELELPASGKLDLVPIPSSAVTRDTIDRTPWGAARLAAAMQRRGLGELKPYVHNAVAQKADHESLRIPT